MTLIIFSDSSRRLSQRMFGSDVAEFQIRTPSPACWRILNSYWVLFDAGRDRRTDLVHRMYMIPLLPKSSTDRGINMDLNEQLPDTARLEFRPIRNSHIKPKELHPK
jgi:hypothetical protein